MDPATFILKKTVPADIEEVRETTTTKSKEGVYCKRVLSSSNNFGPVQSSRTPPKDIRNHLERGMILSTDVGTRTTRSSTMQIMAPVVEHWANRNLSVSVCLCLCLMSSKPRSPLPCPGLLNTVSMLVWIPQPLVLAFPPRIHTPSSPPKKIRSLVLLLPFTVLVLITFFACWCHFRLVFFGFRFWVGCFYPFGWRVCAFPRSLFHHLCV
jgi:hypothetical protein